MGNAITTSEQPLQTFHGSRLPHQGAVTAVIGKRGGGKTTILKTLLGQRSACRRCVPQRQLERLLLGAVSRDVANYVAKKPRHNPYYAQGLVFSSTEDTNHAWAPHVPAECIRTEYDPQVLKDFIDAQCERINEATTRFYVQHDRIRTPVERQAFMIEHRAFVVLDDAFYDRARLNRDRTLQRLFMNGRHFNIDVYITLQRLLDLNPMLREQIDVLCFTKILIRTVKEKLYNHYFSFINTLAAFETMLHNATQNYGALVLRQLPTAHYRVDDHLFTYRGEVGLAFKPLERNCTKASEKDLVQHV